LYNNNAQGGLELFTYLKTNELLEYGATVPVKKIQELLGIVIPEVGTKSQFDELSLIELSMIGHVRRMLVNEGKYIQQDGSAYRILLPSENAKKVDNLMEAAARKLRRAKTLHHNTPKDVNPNFVCNKNVRIAAKLDAIKEAQAQANLMS